MGWQRLSDFLAMGGYAAYVWTSFGATALCMVFEMMALRRRARFCDTTPVRLAAPGQES